MNTTHIIRITFDHTKGAPDQSGMVPESSFNARLGFLEDHGTRIGGIQGREGLFLATHQSLLRFLAQCPTHYRTMSIEVFSLSAPEAQIVASDGALDRLSLETYRIARTEPAEAPPQ